MVGFSDKKHYYFLVSYVAINYILHLFSFSEAIYVHGADASRYYGAALSLSQGDGFGDLLNTGPVYPLFLSIHYAILGFDYGNNLLVITQSILVYFTGTLVGNLTNKIAPYNIGWIAMLLVIFNPNTIITAHLVQTESLFALLLVGYLYTLIRLIKKGGMRQVIILALIALLVSLTRPAGMYIMLLFIIPSAFLVLNRVSWLKVLSINVIYYSILLLGLGLWSLNNYDKHGEFFVSANEGTVFRAQYIALLQYGKSMSLLEASNKSDIVYKNMIEKEGVICDNGIDSFKCRKIIAKSYIQAMMNEDLYTIIRAGTSSFINLMFSGGASNFANYYGIDNKSSVLEFERSAGSMMSIDKAIKFIDSTNIKYFFALIVFWGYAITTKLLLMSGLIYLWNNSNNRYLIIVMLLYILLFAAEYLFLGQSRWRVPLDPIMMVFSAFGVYRVINFYNKMHV